jgi:hypothetical protein
MDPRFAAEEISRLGFEAARLSEANGGHGPVSSIAGRVNRAYVGAPQGSRPEYDHAALAAPGTGPAGFTHGDIEAAALELSEKTGYAYQDIMTVVRDAAPGRDVQESAVVLAALAQDLLPLTYGGYDDDTIGLAASISDEERREAARKGWALPDGSYPIRSKKELQSAAVLAASGHGDVAAAKRLIRKRARELGVDVTTLPGFGGSGYGDHDLAASHPQRRLVRTGSGYGTVSLSGDELDEYELAYLAELDAAAEGMDDDSLLDAMRSAVAQRAITGPSSALAAGAAAEVARLSAEHSEFFELAAKHSQRHPDGTYRPAPRKGMTAMHEDPGSSTVTDVDAEVKRYLGMADSDFGAERPYGSVAVTRPKSFSQRAAESRRARPGHSAPESWTGVAREGERVRM